MIRSPVGVAVDPTLVTTLDINMRSMWTARPADAPSATNPPHDPVKTMKVAVGVDVPRFLNEFMTRISGLAAKAQ